jgi:tocopherol cyclase
MSEKNSFMLHGNMLKHGYDWWRHLVIAEHRRSGEKQPFSFEYFVINPDLGGQLPITSQLPENHALGVKPTYALLRVTTWQPGNLVQINNLYGIEDFRYQFDPFRISIASSYCNDTELKGSVSTTHEQAQAHPEFFSDSGHISWDLQVKKMLAYDVGGPFTTKRYQRFSPFPTAWHVDGMYTRYDGSITFNGEDYEVTKNSLPGYQDKVWGSDYPTTWAWLTCNQLTSRLSNQTFPLTGLTVGGMHPLILGRHIFNRPVVAFFYKGERFDYNPSKFWQLSEQKYIFRQDDNKVEWIIVAVNYNSKIKIEFSCPKRLMKKVYYENPDGDINFPELWSTGWASGTVTLYRGRPNNYQLVDAFGGEFGFGTFGELPKP